MVLRKYSKGPLAIGRIVHRAKRWNRGLEDGFVLVFQTGRGQVVAAKLEVRARVQCIGRSIVDAHESEITERIKSRKRREPWQSE